MKSSPDPSNLTGVPPGGWRPMLVRALLLGLSAAGMFVPAVVWALGHGHLAARLFAGDVLLLLVLLLVL